jgi:hypothetical protein
LSDSESTFSLLAERLVAQVVEFWLLRYFNELILTITSDHVFFFEMTTPIDLTISVVILSKLKEAILR